MKKIVTITSFLFLFSFQTFSQAPDWEWAKHAGGNGDDMSNCVATDAFGNVYIAGFISSDSILFGSILLTGNSGGNIFLTKYDPAGNVIWAKNAGGSSWDEALSITIDKWENIYVTGYYLSNPIAFGSILLPNNSTSQNESDMFLAKYDSSGNVIWAKRAGGNYNDQGNYVKTDAAGNIYLIGYFDSDSITFGNTTLLYPNDNFFVKYDSSGNVIWAKGAGATNNDFISSISIDTSGRIYIAGAFNTSTFTFDTITLSNNGIDEIFIIRVDSSGNIVWVNSENAFIDGGQRITNDEAGNIYLSGTFVDTLILGIDTLIPSGGTCIYIAKFDSSGNNLWAKISGKYGDAFPISITSDPFGNAYIAGVFNHPSITFDTITLYKYDTLAFSSGIFIAKYNSSGNLKWAKGTGGANIDYAYGITSDENGNVYITGSFRSDSIVFGFFPLTDVAYDDIFLAKLYSCNAVQPLISINGNTTFCQGDSVTLTSSLATSYIWSTGSTNQNITVYNSGSFFVNIMDNSGCGASSNLITTTAIQTVFNVSAAICHGETYTFPDSTTSMVDTVEVSHFTAINSCDSNIVTTLNVIVVDTSVLVDSTTLTSSATNSSFQWINCGNGNAIIPGATDQSYTATTNGSYAVVVTISGCRDTSSCYDIINNAGIPALSLQISNVKIYPNPNDGNFVLSYNFTNSQLSTQSSSFIMTDISGRNVYAKYIIGLNGKEDIDVSNLNNGIYFYQLRNEKETVQGKIIIEK